MMREATFIEEWIEEARQEALQQGLEQGLEQGLMQGMEQGLKQGLEQGLMQGMEQGLKQGLESGLERGKREQALVTLVRILEHRFGRVPAAVRDRLVEMTLGQLEDLTDVALETDSLQTFEEAVEQPLES